MRRIPAQIRRIRAGKPSRGVTTPVSLVYLPVSLTGPGPSGSAEPARLCRGCSRPSRRPPGRAASSFIPPLRRRNNGRSFTSIRNTRASWRSYVRLTDSTYIRCCTYEDAAPILTIQDGPAEITITNPGRGEVTEEDVRFGRLLAEAVARYAAELEKHAANRTMAADPDSAGRAA